MSSPFPDRTVEAVGACTRALAGLADADAAVAQSNAATLSALRAFGDRLALRARFHDSAVHARHRPGTETEADLFDALEHARLDAIGRSGCKASQRISWPIPGRSQKPFAGSRSKGSAAWLLPKEKTAIG